MKKSPTYEFAGIIDQRVGLFYKGVPWVWDTHAPEGVVTIYSQRGMTPDEGAAYSELVTALFKNKEERKEVTPMAKKKPSKKKC